MFPSSNVTNSSYLYDHSKNPWDILVDRMDSTLSRAVDIVVIVVPISALLLYLLTCYVIRRRPELWKRMSYRLLLVQNIYEASNLAGRLLSLLVTYDFYQDDESVSIRGSIGCALFEFLEFLYPVNLMAHLMVAGNRFVAVVFYQHYTTLFTSRFTSLYILSFLILPSLMVISLKSLGLRICSRTRLGVLYTAPSPSVMQFYVSLHIIVSAVSVFILVALYTIIIYKLRNVIKKRQRAKAAVAPLSSLTIPVQSVDQGTSTTHSSAVVVVVSGAASTVMDSQELKLTLHFILVTLVWILTYALRTVSLFLTIPNSYDIFLVVAIINFSANAFIIIIICTEIRKPVVRLITCK